MFPRTRVAAVLVALLLGGALLGGCSGAGGASTDIQARSSPSPSASPSTSPSPNLFSNDFQPPIGPAPPPPGAGNGPWNGRIMLATSTDGLTFQRNNFILTDQGDVPDIVVDSRGFIFVYYVGWTVGTENNKTVCAVSPDGGTTWFYKRVNLTGFEPVPPDAVDPDVQFLANGTFRLYLTHDPDGQGPRIFRGESTSGLDFTNAGVAFSHLPDFAIDPSAVLVPQTQIWHLFAAGGPDQYWHATSPDGASFSFLGEIQFIDDEGERCVPSNGLAVDGAVRLYAFKQDAQVQTQIKSFSSTDGIVWTPESGARLTLDESSGLESQYVKDAAVTRLPGGRFLMVYVTRIPAPGAP